MRSLALFVFLALFLAVPAAQADDPELCHDTPELLFVCLGGGVQGDCGSYGYRYDQVLVMTAAGYVWLIGDSNCWTSDGTTYEDNNVIVGVGTPVGSVSTWWYSSGDSCRLMPRVYDPFGPLVVENLDCPGGHAPPDLAWGELLS